MKHATANRRILLLILLSSATMGLPVACMKQEPGNAPASGNGGQGTGTGGGGGAANPGAGGSGGQQEEDVGPRMDYPPRPDVIKPDTVPFTPMGLSACQKMQMPAFTMVMSQAVFSVTPPPLMDDQQVYRVTIPRFEGGHVGFQPKVAGEYVFYTRTNIPLSVFTLDGTMVNIKMLSGSIAECAEIKGRHAFLLAKDSYVVRLGPAPGMATADVVILPAPM